MVETEILMMSQIYNRFFLPALIQCFFIQLAQTIGWSAEISPKLLHDGVTNLTIKATSTYGYRYQYVNITCKLLQTKPAKLCEKFEPIVYPLEDARAFTISLDITDKTFRPKTNYYIYLATACPGAQNCRSGVHDAHVRFRSDVVLTPHRFTASLVQKSDSISMNLAWVPNTITVNDFYKLKLVSTKHNQEYTKYVDGRKREASWDLAVFERTYSPKETYSASSYPPKETYSASTYSPEGTYSASTYSPEGTDNASEDPPKGTDSASTYPPEEKYIASITAMAKTGEELSISTEQSSEIVITRSSAAAVSSTIVVFVFLSIELLVTN